MKKTLCRQPVRFGIKPARGKIASSIGFLLVLCFLLTVLLPSRLRADEKEVAPIPPVADEGKIQEVTCGFYMNAGGKLDFHSTSVPLDFYMWVSFPNTNEPPTFEFMNSKGVSVEKQTESEPETNPHRICYRINGVFSQDIDFHNFPFLRIPVNILLEDTALEAYERIYTPDVKDSSIDPAFKIIGWNIDKYEISSGTHKYHTGFGSPGGEFESYSQLMFTLHLSRNDFIILLKTATPAVLILLIVLMGIFLPTDQIASKISVSVATLFSSVAYHLNLSKDMPAVGYFTFIDKMMTFNYLIIFITVFFIIVHYHAAKSEKKRLESFLRWTAHLLIPALVLTDCIYLVKSSLFLY